MNKPIEVGCMVLVVAGFNAGRSGIVVEYDPLDDEYPWSVDMGGQAKYATGITDKPVWCSNNDLVRIDDYDSSHDLVEEEKEVTA